MSQNAAAVMPDPGTAYQNLFDGVHAEVFFRKCAAAGYTPGTTDEAVAMLETAASLRNVGHQTKQASAKDSPYLALKTAVDQVLGGQKPSPVEEQQTIKQAADYFANDPTFYNSVLSLKAAQAEDIRQHLSR